MESAFVKQLIEAGVHFGHRCSRWNPKMKPYIYGRKNSIHILDIRETLRGLLRAKKYLNQVAGRWQSGAFCRYQATGVGYGSGASRPLRHAVRIGAMAGGSIDEFPNDSQPVVDAWKSSKRSSIRMRSTPTPRRCSRR